VDVVVLPLVVPVACYFVQHIICCCEALARQRYNVFGRRPAEPKDISTASVRDLLPLCKRHRVIEPVLNGVFRAAQ
jgi:hypothetical protein